MFNYPKDIYATGLVMLLSCVYSTGSLAVQCGDIIANSQVLTDALSCSDDPALTIEGPEGFLVIEGEGSIECTTNGIGIHMLGRSGLVMGGVVTNCDLGLLLDGDGSHKVIGVTVEESSSAAIFAQSDGNLIRQSTVSNTTNVIASGLELDGERNVAVGNNVSGFLEYGIAGFGFYSYIGNNYVENSELGIILGALVVDGESIGASYCVIESNTVVGSLRTGIGIGAPYTYPNMDNLVTGNTVTGSGNDDILDDNEESDCSDGLNVWSNNTADTSFPSCLKNL
ncbi:hypothetical protein ACJJI3_03900 [Microbulbifer sp. ZKSA004]|uniref:hypothetical protein n=1 Tax=Microbulbifer sp. ZKSA004 TaxID=3243389 RepID=UPI004039F374